MQLKLTLLFLSFPFFLNAQIDTTIVKLLTVKPVIFIDSSILQRNDFNQGAVFQFHGIWKLMDKTTGQIDAVSEYKNGKVHGHQISFYSNGKIAHSLYYSNGVENGPWIYFWGNGNVRNLGYYLDGKLEGLVRSFDTSGNVVRISEYKNGKLDGIDLRLYSSGNIKLITYYTGGQENGIRKEYADNAGFELKGEFEMKNEVPVAGKFYQNGKLVKNHTYNYEEELRKREVLKNQKGDGHFKHYKELLSDEQDPM